MTYRCLHPDCTCGGFNMACRRYQLGLVVPTYRVPAIIYDVYHQINSNTSTEIWERSGTRFAINRRVYAYYARSA